MSHLSLLTSFVQNLELAEMPLNLNNGGLPWSEQVGCAAVIAGQIVGFLPGLTPQQMADINNSSLFAQLAASKKFDRQTETDQWYGFYASTLGKIGWMVSGFSFQKDTQAQALGSCNKTLYVFLATFLSQPGYELFADIFTTLGSLGPNKKPLAVFNSSSSKKNVANFQIGIAYSSDMRGPSIDFGAFVYKIDQDIDKPLWQIWDASPVDFATATQTISLNEEVYTRIRGDILTKLGGNAQLLIAEFYSC